MQGFEGFFTLLPLPLPDDTGKHLWLTSPSWNQGRCQNQKMASAASPDLPSSHHHLPGQTLPGR